MRFCHCGRIAEACPCDRCRKYEPKKKQHELTTKERGYGHDWRRLSERYRAENPLCERCRMKGRVEPATEVHHKQKIAEAPHRRLDVTNLISVCSECHVILESEG